MLHLETLESRCLLSTLVISDFYDPSTPIASLDFGEGNLVGINYPASIGITNTSGESDTASLAMDSDAFTYQQPGNMETPIGSPYSYYGSSTSLFEEATTLTFGQESEPVLVPATGGDQWFYVDAQAGDNLRFSTTTNSLYSVDLQVYSQYYRESEMVVDGDTFEFYSFSSELDSYDSSYSTQGGSLIMPAPYTGRYYVQATTYGGMTAGSFTVEATTLPANPNLTTIALSEDTNTLIVPFSDDPYAAYTGQANNWYAFDASYGDEIELTFAPQGITTIIDLNEISVYNSFGHHIFSGEYNNYIFTDEGIIADKDAGSFTPKIPPLLADGTYYIAIEPGYFNEPDEYFTINLTKTGSMLELEPDESVEIPIWYTPQADGTAEAQLTIKSLSDEAAPEETVTFTGAAIASDFSVVDLQIENLEFPNRVQALSTLDVSATITNSGDGHFFDIPELTFYLSDDMVFDKAVDTLLTFASEPFTTNDRILFGEYLTLTATVNIPEVVPADPANPNYYLFVMANDPDGQQVVPETDTDPTNNTLGYFNSLNLLQPISITSDNLITYDSINEPFDHLIDYGQQAVQIGFPHAEITVHNRGFEAVTINDWSITNDYYFVLGNNNAPDSLQNITLEPGQTQFIHVRFDPQSFPEAGLGDVADVLTIYTTEGEIRYDITGTLTGSDLLVTENSGVLANDKILEFEDTRPGHISLAETLNLFNNGDQILSIQGISFGKGNSSPFSLTTESATWLAEKAKLGTLADERGFNLDIEFSPVRVGTFTDTLTIKSTDPDGETGNPYEFTVDLEAVSTDPILDIRETAGQVNDNVMFFGFHPIYHNETIIQTAELANIGTYPLIISGITFQNEDDDDFRLLNDLFEGNDTFTIEPDESKLLNIEFIATQDNPSYEDYLIIESNYTTSDDQPVKLLLTGSAAIPTMEVTATSQMGNAILDTSKANITTTSQVIIKNTSLVNLNINAIQIDNGFTISIPNLDISQESFFVFGGSGLLKPYEEIRVNVGFDGNNFALGSHTGHLIIDSDLPEDITFSIDAFLATPELELPITSYNFGPDATTTISTTPVTISNTNGTADLIITDWVSSDSQFALVPTPEQLNDRGYLVIPANQSIEVNAQYMPTIPGLFTEHISLISNDPDMYDQNDISIAMITLTGNSRGESVEILANQTFPFRDESGDLVKVTIKNGSAVLYLNNGSQTGGDIYAIDVFDTSEKTKLTIATKGTTSIGYITAFENDEYAGTMASIIAPNADIRNGITMQGSLRELTLNNIMENATITVEDAAEKPMVIKTGQINDNVIFDLNADLKIFQADDFTGGSLTANSINLVNIRRGELGADMLASGIDSGMINRIQAKGNITGDIRALYDINTITSKRGAIEENFIIAGDTSLLPLESQGDPLGDVIDFHQKGNINKISAKGNISSAILALNDIHSITTKTGQFSGTLRANTLNSLRAHDLDNALLGTAGNINSIRISHDVINSVITPGHDIGFDISDPADDVINPYSELKHFSYGTIDAASEVKGF